MDGTGDDPMYVSIHKQLTEAGIEFDAPYDLKSLTLEPGQGLSKRMMERIEEDASAILSVAEDALARGDIRYIRYEVDRLLEAFQINLDPSCEDYRKLSRAVISAQVKQLRAVLARHKGGPVETPALIGPDQNGTPVQGTLKDALAGWQKERSPSPRSPSTSEPSGYSENCTAIFQLLRSSVHTRGHSVRPYRTCLGTAPGHCYTCRYPS